MDENAVEHFLSQVPDVGIIGKSGDWHLTCRCLMPQRHAKGYDSRPSTTVSFDVETPFVECFGCGYKASLERTLHELAVKGRLNPATALAFTDARKQQLVLPPRVKAEPEFGDYTQPLSILREIPYSQETLDFLTLKGVSAKIAEALHVVDVPAHWSDEWMAEDAEGNPKKTPAGGVGLPLYRHDGTKYVCCGVQLRLINAKFRYFALYKFAATRRLFGEQLIPQMAGKHVFLVEGPFDALHILSEGFLSLALLGTNLTKHKALTLKSSGALCYHILLDNDTAGFQGTKKAIDILKEHGVPFVAHKAYKDPKKYSHEELSKLTKSFI